MGRVQDSYFPMQISETPNRSSCHLSYYSFWTWCIRDIKSKGTEEDYYLAGRGQGLLVTSLTIMATFFRSRLVSFPGMVYENGVSAMSTLH